MRNSIHPLLQQCPTPGWRHFYFLILLPPNAMIHHLSANVQTGFYLKLIILIITRTAHLFVHLKQIFFYKLSINNEFPPLKTKFIIDLYYLLIIYDLHS